MGGLDGYNGRKAAKAFRMRASERDYLLVLSLVISQRSLHRSLSQSGADWECRCCAVFLVQDAAQCPRRACVMIQLALRLSSFVVVSFGPEPLKPGFLDVQMNAPLCRQYTNTYQVLSTLMPCMAACMLKPMHFC
jgi:hypothetical protein